jgi:hypothetical protein
MNHPVLTPRLPRPYTVVPRPLKQIQYPWKPREKSMTIVAGFVVNDGILLCGDTMYTGGMKIHQSKLVGATIADSTKCLLHQQAPLAKLLCRTADWIHSPRVPEPRRDSKCPSSQTNAHFVLRLLPAFKNAFSPRKGLPDTPRGVRPREDYPDSLSGRVYIIAISALPHRCHPQT